MNTKYHNHVAKRRAFESRLMFGLFAALTLLGVLSFAGMFGESQGGVAMAALPFLGMRPMLREEFNPHGGDGGGKVLGEAEFQSKVLGSLGKQKTTVDDLVSKFDSLDKDTKKAFEDLTKLKSDASATTTDLTRAIEKLNLRLAQELRMANGNPIARISGDPEKRNLFNAAVRAACGFGLTPEMRTTLGEDSTPGSTLIVDALAGDIYDTLATYGVWSSFDVRQAGVKTTKLPVKTARPAASWILTEGGGITEDTAKAGTSVDCVLEVAGVLLPVSKQLLADSSYDITGDVLMDFAEALSYLIDWSCLQADGGADATDGGMTGLFGGGATACVAGDGNTTVETLDFEDYTKALLTVDPVVLGRGARWWMHPQTLVRALSTKDASGRPIFLTALEAPTVAGLGSILGYPVVPSFAAPVANTASSKVAVFGDPKGLVVGIQNGFEFEASDHAGFTTYERYFRGIARAGVKVRRAEAFACLTLAAS